MQKKEYKNALDAYQQSLSAFQKTKYRTQIRNVYDSIASTYHYLDDPKMANEYLKKYKAVNDTLKNEEKEAVTIAVNKLLQEEKQDKQKEKKAIVFHLCRLYCITSFNSFRNIADAALEATKEREPAGRAGIGESAAEETTQCFCRSVN